MKTEIPWRHFFFCMLINGALIALIEPTNPFSRAAILLGTVTTYIVIAKIRMRRTRPI